MCAREIIKRSSIIQKYIDYFSIYSTLSLLLFFEYARELIFV